MSGHCDECGNTLCLCDKNKPNNKFKHGDWVIGENTAFKVDSIKVYGESFGYSGESIDGYFSEDQLERAHSSIVIQLNTIGSRLKELK